MGVCTSSKSGVRQIIDEFNENADYEKHREDIMESRQEGIFEVKAKLFEYAVVNAKILRRTLICKYLFFTSDGKFSSSVSTTNSNILGGLLIEGYLNPQSLLISLTSKRLLVENNAYRIRIYEGKLIFDDKECIVKGNVIEDGAKGKSRLDDTTFEIDFTTKLWLGNYIDLNNKSIMTLAYIRYKEFNFSGIARDSKGVSLIKGKSSDKIDITQTYIKPNAEDNKKPNPKDVMIIEGTLNGDKIEGSISNSATSFKSTLVLENKGNPRKLNQAK